jgi:diguanylate cyclase (GGDEF)-like protein
LQAQNELELRQAAEKRLSEANQQLTTQLTEIQKLQKILREQAIRDSLTGLFNRRFLEESFIQALARAEREKQNIGVILLDIDKFKNINDTYGHAAGDQVLVAMAKTLLHQMRSSDTICRYGGEEFLLVLPNSNLEETRRRAEDLHQAVGQLEVLYGESRLKVTASLGIASYPLHGLGMDELVRHADNNLYMAKNNGRNQVVG